MPTPNTRRLEKLFPVPVLLTKVPNAGELNDDLITALEEIRASTPNGKPSSWACDIYTTYTNNCALHEQPAFKEFSDIAFQCLSAFGDVMGYDMDEGKICMTQCWLNIYQHGMSQEVHHHPNHHMTGVYYVKAPEDCSEIMFHSPYADTMIRPPVTGHSPLSSMIASYNPEPGDLIVFDSALRHSVPNHMVDGERISISFNARI